MQAVLSFIVIAVSGVVASQASDFFRITVVDEQTARGVPLVELRTVNGIKLYTDSAGVVAFHEPGLMGKDVFFHVSSHGYEFPKDGFGIRGKMLKVKAGGATTLKIKRLNIAERLYRITGGGIYRDSVLVGAKAPLKEPVLNGLVVGSDSVMNAVYRGKIHWFWGDTNRPSYPLGNFHVPGATSLLPGKGGLDPDVGVNLDYFVDARGFAKETMRFPGKGPTWMTTLVPLADDGNRERLHASYVKVQPPLTIYARGLAVWDDDKKGFKPVAGVDMKAPIFPMGHAFRYGDHVYFAHPFPVTRVRASAKAFLDIKQYEAFTCLKEGSRLDELQFDRDVKARLRYAWRKNAPALDPQKEAKLIAGGKIKADEARWQLRDAAGKRVTPHAGSVYWNEYRKRWILIATQIGGTSLLGEIWYAEAEAPVGPWDRGVKIVTHDRYSFYNPKQHPMFAKGRYLYFEGTYTHTFSGNPHATPRYDYNQIMYRLDLSDSRLRPSD
ncbi:MAG: hypothetical protein HYX68_24725 [Planctomycetes bacterium]|nr:hypothetical protein [Planctomycetota bacterium]